MRATRAVGPPPLRRPGRKRPRHTTITWALRAAAAAGRGPRGLAQDSSDTAAELARVNRKLDVLYAELEDLRSGAAPGASDADRLTISGYGEYHGNLTQDGSKYSDPHRFVVYLGYDFGDDISLHSETEIEHGFVADGDGEISIEQLYADIQLGDTSGLRIGRMLNPLGIINQRHEPTTFSGVERPNLEKYIIPSTWSQDGVGLWGAVSENVTYELQLTSGLDGSGFSDKDGIRGGRMKERPGLSDPALSGRLDWRPDSAGGLRLGGSFYSGGADNGNQGSDPGVDSRVDILALDFEYSIGAFDLRGVLAQSHISGADDLNAAFGNNVGEEQAGWYLQADCHLFEAFEGFGPSDEDARFPDSDLVAFLRLEEYDTLDQLAIGGAGNPAASREETTFGLGYWLTPNFVVKADYQVLDDDTDARSNQLSLGIGWTLLP
ncbi:MAG: hypothetical protein P1V81_10775 [Planctomycetota bacterium]|nr:hypothetical protein [Planctomycetota bacterium]